MIFEIYISRSSDFWLFLAVVICMFGVQINRILKRNNAKSNVQNHWSSENLFEYMNRLNKRIKIRWKRKYCQNKRTSESRRQAQIQNVVFKMKKKETKKKTNVNVARYTYWLFATADEYRADFDCQIKFKNYDFCIGLVFIMMIAVIIFNLGMNMRASIYGGVFFGLTK